MTQQKKTFIAIICILIIGGGVGTFKWLKSTRKAPEKIEQPYLGPLVEVMEVMAQDKEIIIPATGTVNAAEEITVIPQVSGLVNTVNPNLKSGGFIEKGETLFSLDDIDYRTALKHAQAGVAKAEYELAAMRSRAEVARLEWERLKENTDKSPDPLLLFVPQLKNAEAMLESAKAQVTTANTNIKRTHIVAPFDAIVRYEKVDPGQFVSPGMVVASLASTEKVEILVQLRTEDIPHLDIPGSKETNVGSLARIELRTGEFIQHWEGRITRMLGEVNPKNRMDSVIITVSDPYGLKNNEIDKRPLSLGLFVDISLKGKTIPKVISIPRNGLRDNSTVWIMDKEGKLRIKKVEILRFDRNDALIGKGITPGDKIILTNLSGVTDGMKIRTADQEKNI